MLAGDLPALEIEGVAVAVIRRHAEYADGAIVVDPTQLAIVWDIAPDEIAALSIPCRPLCPQRTLPQPHDRCIWLHVLPKHWIDDDDVGIPEIGRRSSVGAKVARRGGYYCLWRGLFRLSHCAARTRHRGAGRHCPDQRPPRYQAALSPALVLSRHSASSRS